MTDKDGEGLQNLEQHLEEELRITGDAKRFVLDLWLVCQFFDDAADGHIEGAWSQEEIAKIMTKCLVEIPSNPFFCAHRVQLSAPIFTAIATWAWANNREAEGLNPDTRPKAFTRRTDWYHVLVLVYALIHGPQAAIEMVDIILMVDAEKFVDYIEENLNV